MQLQRHPGNPILTRADIPPNPPLLVDVSSVFNPGAVLHDGHDLLLLRVQNRGRETHLLRADRSADGSFAMRGLPVHFHGIDRLPGPIHHIYDPRITAIEGSYVVTFAIDLARGCRIGLARTVDFERYEFIGLAGDTDSRNGVLFPERVGGRYLMLERPNLVTPADGPTTGETIVLSESEDLVAWRRVRPVMHGRPHLWDERIGSGPPPVKTHHGWLHIYHGVATHFGAANIYQAGVVLLDLNDPWRVVARSRFNILEPREMYEMVGQVPNVVFPSGMVVDAFDTDGFADDDSAVRIYYGAADTAVGLAITTIDELIASCREGADA
jgi:beta-1,4-mannooligosaccharide/beta-1,4-mannosyl-N-acetylglucosamine phosphorylase